MSTVRSEIKDNRLIVFLEGRIDSGNAQEVEEELLRVIKEQIEDTNPSLDLIIDAEKLDYISSAGLRVLLHIRKRRSELVVRNVNNEVYEIFDMTGFNQMMTVEKAYKTVSTENCEVIGSGVNGTIYRIDKDNVVKVYNNADALSEIQNEREVAKLALILGIPTAISYDVVKVGDSYGSVFELLNARSFAQILTNEPEKFDWCVEEYVKLLKTIHGTLVPEGKLKDIKEKVIPWAHIMQEHLPQKYGDKLLALVEAVPNDNHMIHGDYHSKNVMLQNDEVLLIDMDTLSVGNPIFELGFIFNAFVGYYEMNPESILKFQGYDIDTSHRFWKAFLSKYLGTDDEERIKAVEDKAKIVGYTRLIRRSYRLGGLETEEGRREIDLWTKELMELLDKVDTLLIDDPSGDPKSGNGDESDGDVLKIDAVVSNFDQVTDFINARLEAIDCPMKTSMQIVIVAEEVFTNIAKYAYGDEIGEAVIKLKIYEPSESLSGQREVELTFMDHGIPYNPLANEDPDITLSAEEREIGGLGIFMTKQMMDDLSYEYKADTNILRLRKQI